MNGLGVRNLEKGFRFNKEWTAEEVEKNLLQDQFSNIMNALDTWSLNNPNATEWSYALCEKRWYELAASTIAPTGLDICQKVISKKSNWRESVLYLGKLTSSCH